MRYSVRTLLCLLGTSTALLPLAACSSSSSPADAGTFPDATADAGQDAAKEAASDAAKDSGAKDAAKDVAKDTGTKDAAPEAETTDANDAEAATDAASDGTTDGATDAVTDALSDVTDAAEDVHDASMPTLVDYYFMGRWDTTSQAAYATQPLAEWAGSGVLATFTGTAIAIDVVETPSATSASLGGGGYDSLSVVIDGGTPTVVALGAGFTTGGTCPLPAPQTCVPGENAMNVAMGLAAGTHTIAIYKTTDPFYGGKIQFKQLIPSGMGAAIVKASYTFAHHIEWIGDDINVGRGEGTAPGTCNSSNAEVSAINSASNESLGYAGLVSTFFKAERHNISLATSGVYESLGDTAPLLPSVYGYVLPDEPTNAWSFTQWSPGVAAPDLVVVNLGGYGDFTNCVSGTDCPDVGATGTTAPPAGTVAAGIATAYDALLATVRTKYPSAFILVVSGNGYAGNVTPPAASDLVNYVVNQRVTLGGEKLTAPNQTMAFYTDAAAVNAGSFTYTCNYYPDGAAQATLATAVEGVIHTALGW